MSLPQIAEATAVKDQMVDGLLFVIKQAQLAFIEHFKVMHRNDMANKV